MFRSTGGLTLIVSSNKFIIQVSGEAFLFLDQEDIQDILRRAKNSIQLNRKYDIEKFFELNDSKKSGRERTFTSSILGESSITGKSWIRNTAKNIYLKNIEELKKEPQPILKKRDFIRIYDKLVEVI